MALAKKYLSTPVEMPNGVFKDAVWERINYHAINKKNGTLADLLKTGKEYNVTFLIAKYFESVYHDDCQPFYGYKRAYDFFDVTQNKRNARKQLVSSYFTSAELVDLTRNAAAREKRIAIYKKTLVKDKNGNIEPAKKDEVLKALFNEVRINEKNIRERKIEDMLTMMMAKKLLFGTNGVVGKDLYLKRFNNDSLSQKLTSLSLKCRINGEQKEIVATDISLKDYNELWGLLNDKRIISLLRNISDYRIMKSDLDVDLDNFDESKMDINMAAFKLYALSQKLSLPISSPSPSFREILIPFNVDSWMFDCLTTLRNSFEHDFYPLPHDRAKAGLTNNTAIPNFSSDMRKKFIATLNNLIAMCDKKS